MPNRFALDPRSRLAVVVAAVVVVACPLALSACDDTRPGGTGGQVTPDGGVDAGCPVGPQPMFTLTITAADGPVPPDTSLEVTWSAGSEPTFKLANPATWKTLDMGANVVCAVDPKSPPPKDLTELVCSLWTSGPTEVTVAADRYQTHTETLVPTMNELCEGPVPTAVKIELLPDVDAGP